MAETNHKEVWESQVKTKGCLHNSTIGRMSVNKKDNSSAKLPLSI